MITDQRAVQKITQATTATQMVVGRKTALYMRLSSDDGGVNESDSIVHQRQILTQYTYDHGFANIMEFVEMESSFLIQCNDCFQNSPS
jgi:hypothetical protein